MHVTACHLHVTCMLRAYHLIFFKKIKIPCLDYYQGMVQYIEETGVCLQYAPEKGFCKRKSEG